MIKAEKTGWGTRLRGRPFSETRPEIEILVEVEKPRPGRNPATKIYFGGVPSQTPLGRTDVAAWVNCLRSMLDQADEVSAKMQVQAKKAQPPRKPPKKD